jgi:hypothetical protein|tara:strand:+ start:159 stop:620 length:462 start_codon:yes stop_codon:yes gene_type:complete
MKILTDANLEQYTDEFYEVEPEDYRPVLIEPGKYPAELVDWSKEYSRQFRKLTLVMNFRIGADVIPSWFNIEPSDSETTVKAGWKSNFLRMYQGCLNVRLDRRDRISMKPFAGRILKVEVVSITRDSDGSLMSEVNHYSRVKKILGVREEVTY